VEEIRFDDRVAVVTGAGGGLGRAHALLLASRGAKVVVNDLGGTTDGTGADQTPAQKVVDEIKAAGGEAVPDYHSVSEWDSAQAIIQTALDAYGKIDILINNAGILRDKSFLKMDIEDYRIIMAVHLDGTFFCTKAAFPHMRENNYGRVLFTISAAGVYGNFGQTNYGAAKMGMVGLMNCLKLEGAKYNIMVNCLAPIAGTRLTATVMPPEMVDKLHPEWVSPMAVWLCSEQCAESGKTFTAGAGYFSRALILEAPGIFLDIDKDLTVEMVAENIEKIKDATGAAEFNTLTEQTMKVLSHLEQSQ
jgi:NAD(P)-dependent dehydrogenase (short-subunit alcohol dehydrogenase family)